MRIYLLKKETNEEIDVFENVIEWAEDFVVFQIGTITNKIYATEDQYFTDKLNVEENVSNREAF